MKAEWRDGPDDWSEQLGGDYPNWPFYVRLENLSGYGVTEWRADLRLNVGYKIRDVSTYARRRDAIRGIWRTLQAIRSNAKPGSRQYKMATKAIEALNEAEKAAGRKAWPISRESQVPDVFPTAAQGNSANAESQAEFQRYAREIIENAARQLGMKVPDCGRPAMWTETEAREFDYSEAAAPWVSDALERERLRGKP